MVALLVNDVKLYRRFTIMAKWITPFWKQLFVVTGASISMSELSLAIGFTARLLPQLKEPGSTIYIDDDLGSWIAAILGISLIFGNLTVAAVMGRYGRKIASLISITLNLIGWIWIAVATSIESILMARTLQGFASGMVTCLSPIVIGEFTSPRNRGAFISIIMFVCSLQILVIHTLGSYLSWQMTALVSAVISFISLLILIFSPESPSWLADQGKYEECGKVFRWLRGSEEEEELKELIEASKTRREIIKPTIQPFWNAVIEKVKIWKTITKRTEFFIPIIIMFHLYTLAQWSGLNVLVAFTEDFFYYIVGPNVDFVLQILLLDISRLFSTIFAIYLTKQLRRRLLLFITGGLNATILFIIALYSYAKVNNVLPYDHHLLGIFLSHILIVSISLGALHFPIVISGELFPLEFRSFAGGISNTFISLNYFVTVKTFQFFLMKWGLHGTALMYGVVTSYCLIISLLLLPETKDRTLQSIENELKGIRQPVNQSAIPLTSLNC